MRRALPWGGAGKARAAMAAVLLAAAALAPEARALVGRWTSFTNLNDVRDMEVLGNSLFVGTAGGIRKLPLTGGETVFRNAEGLLDVSISGLAATPEGVLWAMSERGILYRLRPGQERWDAFGLSYRSAGWRLNRRAILYKAPYLILGSVKGLSFFNVRSGIADVNVTRMGTETSLSVNSVLIVGDTLFAGTSKGIFRSTFHFDRLLTDPEINVFNPAIWTRVEGTDSSLYHDPEEVPAAPDTLPSTDTLPPPDSMKVPADADEAKAHGMLYYTGKGIGSEYEGSADGGVRLSKYGGYLAEGKILPNPYRMEALAVSGKRWFTGGTSGLFEFVPATGAYLPLFNEENLPPGVGMISANPYGVHILAGSLVYRLENRRWRPVSGFTTPNHQLDATNKGSHPFNVLGRDEIYLGTWGYGFYAFSGGKGRAYISGDEGVCLESAVESDPRYTVIFSQTPHHGKGIWMGSLRSGKNYNLAYYDAGSGELECFEVSSGSPEPRSMELVGDVLVVVTGNGVESFKVRDRSGRISLEPANLTPSLRAPDAEETHSGRMDGQNNLWVTTRSGRMLFVPSIRFDATAEQGFRTLEGFPGKECKSLARDARGHVWAGCSEGGLVEITPGRDTLSHAFRRYGLIDGLLSETIFSLDVDSTTGDVWAVTDKGLSRYESASRPLARNLSSARVYPNPFLSKHAYILFDGLAAGSEIQVLTQSGSVVYHRSLASGDGGQLRWDGRNRSGMRVREGIYLYVIRSPKEVKNGKIIVAR